MVTERIKKVDDWQMKDSGQARMPVATQCLWAGVWRWGKGYPRTGWKCFGYLVWLVSLEDFLTSFPVLSLHYILCKKLSKNCSSCCV